QSSGDLENAEATATVLSELVATACGLRLARAHHPPFKRLSGEGGRGPSPGGEGGWPWWPPRWPGWPHVVA
uniref:Ragulator complex protein LAMTOR4 n=1 Tax=Falco tinnunculus TaxID=100819 RepID=A0A8C4XKR5_FALTI